MQSIHFSTTSICTLFYMYFPLPSMHCKKSWQPQLLGRHTCPTPSKHYLWNDGVIRPPHTASRGATRGLITVKMPALSLHVEPAASPHKNRGPSPTLGATRHNVGTVKHHNSHTQPMHVSMGPHYIYIHV